MQYREKILNIDEDDLPVEWSEFEANGLEEVKQYIENRTPRYLDCQAKICMLEDACLLNQETQQQIKKEIYAHATGITATKEIYSLRQLKIFCW